MDAKTWFKERTFYSEGFINSRQELARLKRQVDLTVSVGIPTLNEEATVGYIVRIVQDLAKIGLVDEVAVLDSGSTDATEAVARDAGADFYHMGDVLPHIPYIRGKGESLWRSLHVLRGDIILWVDGDIRNFHRRFITHLLAPLLHYDDIQYVKGFYERPLQTEGEFQATGGGRVTELVARPLLNMFFPQLSHVIQPLSGEYGGRKAFLKTLQFYTGYGVEVGLLIDIVRKYDLSVMAQSDLEIRIHHNKPTLELSTMAHAIMQVVFNELDPDFTQKYDLNRTFYRVSPQPRGLEVFEEVRVEPHRRPPMVEVERGETTSGTPH